MANMNWQERGRRDRNWSEDERMDRGYGMDRMSGNMDWGDEERDWEMSERGGRYGSGFGTYGKSREMGRDYRGMNRDFGRGMNRDQSRGMNRDQSHDMNRDYSRDFGPSMNRDFSRDFGPDTNRDYGRDLRGNPSRDNEWRGAGMDRDYGRRSYGIGRSDFGLTNFGDYGRGDYGRSDWRRPMERDEERSFFERLRDFFTRDSDEQPRRRGPKGWKRSDERIREDVCEILADSDIDSSDVTVKVESGEVTLEGSVMSRRHKRVAELLAEDVRGVDDVHNHLRVKREEVGMGSIESRGSSMTSNAGQKSNDRARREGSVS